MDNFFKGIGAVVVIFVVVIGLGLLIAFPVMWLINFTFSAPALIAVFGVTQIPYWKAYGLYVLASVLFAHGTTSSK